MGKTQSKDETIIVQNAAGGDNHSDLEQFKFHLSTTNILLSVIVLAIGVGALYGVYRTYKRCHMKWITSEITKNTLRRSLFRQYQRAPLPIGAATEAAESAFQPQAVFSTFPAKV